VKVDKMPGRLPFSVFLVSLLLASCSAPYVGGREASQDELVARRAIVDYASSLVGTRDLRPLGHGFKNDCSGFINGVFRKSGRRIDYRHVRGNRSLSESLYRTLRDRDLVFSEYQPNLGDVVFFRNTTENSQADDITHVALVEQIERDGTFSLIHYSSGKVNRMKMNLRHPGKRANDAGRVINDYARRSVSGSPRRDYLAGNLFAAFGDLFRHTGR
jgi:hypothetical protein